MKRICLVLLLILFSTCTVLAEDDESKMFQNSDFIEKEQPALTEETKKLISSYQKDPTMENYLSLREEVIKNYDAVLDRKEEKLASLKEETNGKPGGEDIVAEMEEIVQDMYKTYWDRINSTMLRFTDTRLLKWKTDNAYMYEFVPVMGAGETVYIKRTEVTNAEYAEFIEDTGYSAPVNWLNGTYPQGEEDYPVNFVSYQDAVSYCEWLSEKDGFNTYRLPSESEWELAAGHMPKDADFNCETNDGRTPVDQYENVTRGAHGAIDFWGNVWEWTSTVRNDSVLGVKGGSYNSDRTDCRSENRKEGRVKSTGYEDVGFRVIKVLGGVEPSEKVELNTLEVPDVDVIRLDDKVIEISWNKIEGANEYQIFEYSNDTGLVSMLETTTETSYTIDTSDNSYSYIVQPISYTAICDDVDGEFSVGVSIKEEENIISKFISFLKNCFD